MNGKYLVPIVRTANMFITTNKNIHLILLRINFFTKEEYFTNKTTLPLTFLTVKSSPIFQLIYSLIITVA